MTIVFFAWAEPVSKSGEADAMLECSYAVIPEVNNQGMYMHISSINSSQWSIKITVVVMAIGSSNSYITIKL